MRIVLMILSYIGLGFTIIPSVLVLTGSLSMEMNKTLMMAGTVLWFVTVPFWMDKKSALE